MYAYEDTNCVCLCLFCDCLGGLAHIFCLNCRILWSTHPSNLFLNIQSSADRCFDVSVRLISIFNFYALSTTRCGRADDWLTILIIGGMHEASKRNIKKKRATNRFIDNLSFHSTECVLQIIIISHFKSETKHQQTLDIAERTSNIGLSTKKHMFEIKLQNIRKRSVNQTESELE